MGDVWQLEDPDAKFWNTAFLHWHVGSWLASWLAPLLTSWLLSSWQLWHCLWGCVQVKLLWSWMAFLIWITLPDTIFTLVCFDSPLFKDERLQCSVTFLSFVRLIWSSHLSPVKKKKSTAAQSTLLCLLAFPLVSKNVKAQVCACNSSPGPNC